MTPETPKSPGKRPSNPGDVAGGTYGRDDAAIARRSPTRTEKDGGAALEQDDRPEPALDDEPEGRTSNP